MSRSQCTRNSELQKRPHDRSANVGRGRPRWRTSEGCSEKGEGSGSSAPCGRGRSLPPVHRTVARAEDHVRAAREVHSRKRSWPTVRDLEVLHAETFHQPRQCPGSKCPGMELDTNEEISKLRARGGAPDGTPITSGGRVQSFVKGQDIGRKFHRSIATAKRSQCQPFGRYEDSDRCSRFHIEASRERRSVTRSIQHEWVRVIDARYGIRGVRVGEASHPGPPGSLLRRLRTSRQGALTPIDTANRTDVDSEALLDLSASHPQRLQ